MRVSLRISHLIVGSMFAKVRARKYGLVSSRGHFYNNKKYFYYLY